MLRFRVVKSCNAANSDQLRISFIILQTNHFFLQKLVNLICFSTGCGGYVGGNDPTAEYATDNPDRLLIDMTSLKYSSFRIV